MIKVGGWVGVERELWVGVGREPLVAVESWLAEQEGALRRRCAGWAGLQPPGRSLWPACSPLASGPATHPACARPPAQPPSAGRVPGHQEARGDPAQDPVPPDQALRAGGDQDQVRGCVPGVEFGGACRVWVDRAQRKGTRSCAPLPAGCMPGCPPAPAGKQQAAGSPRAWSRGLVGQQLYMCTAWHSFPHALAS